MDISKQYGVGLGGHAGIPRRAKIRYCAGVFLRIYACLHGIRARVKP